MVGCLVELVVLLYRLLLEQNNPVFWSIMGGCYVLCFLVFSLLLFLGVSPRLSGIRDVLPGTGVKGDDTGQALLVFNSVMLSIIRE